MLRLGVEHRHLPSLGAAFAVPEEAGRIFAEAGDFVGTLDEGKRLDEVSKAFTQIGSSVTAATAARVADVITVCATDPRPLRRDWTPEEVADARRRILASEPAAVVNWIPGNVGVAVVILKDIQRKLEANIAQLDQARRELSPTGDTTEDDNGVRDPRADAMTGPKYTGCHDCGVETLPVDSRRAEYYSVHNNVGPSRMQPNGGCLCIGCLELRIGTGAQRHRLPRPAHQRPRRGRRTVGVGRPAHHD